MNIEARPCCLMDHKCSISWSAIDADTYDGTEDSSNRHMIGFGATKQEAVDDLMRLMQERAEYLEDQNGR